MQSPICPTTTAACSLHAYSYIQQSGHIVKTMNAKNTKKSPIHDNADTNINCDFGDTCPIVSTFFCGELVTWTSDVQLEPNFWQYNGRDTGSNPGESNDTKDAVKCAKARTTIIS